MVSRAQRWLFAIFNLCLWSGAALAEECDPEKFLLMEKTNLLKNDMVRLAFVERMDKSSFEAAQKAEKTGVSFPIYGTPIGAYHDVDEAKQAGRKESQEKRFNYDRDQSYWLIKNEVSKEGGKRFTDCLNSQSAGLHLSLVSETGPKYKVALRLRNVTEFNWKTPKLENFVMTSTPDVKLDPARIYTYEFRRVNNEEYGSIELRVGSYRDQLDFPPVPKPMRRETKVYESEGMAYATSYWQDGTRSGRLCEKAPEGWHFVKGTEQDVPKKGTDSGAAGGLNKDKPFDISPDIACINNWAYTGDEAVRRTREDGFKIVIERWVPVNAEKAKNTSSGNDTKKRPKRREL